MALASLWIKIRNDLQMCSYTVSKGILFGLIFYDVFPSNIFETVMFLWALSIGTFPREEVLQLMGSQRAALWQPPWNIQPCQMLG